MTIRSRHDIVTYIVTFRHPFGMRLVAAFDVADAKAIDAERRA
jgi:hypothetical protein